MAQLRGVKAITAAGIGLTLLTTAFAAAAVPAAGAGLLAAAVVLPRCSSGVPGDVNGDGFAEVAFGEPGNDRGRGAVHVFYGQRSGLVTDASGTARNDHYFTQDSPGVPGTAEVDDHFGTDTLLADFNADGCADLVVGSVGEDARGGLLTVFSGSPTGLSATGVKSFGMSDLFGKAASAPDQGLGDTLAVGDLDGDGINDLAAGVTGLIVGGKEGAGGVALLYGSTQGLNLGSKRPVLLTRNTAGVPGDAEVYGSFGAAVVTGDFDGNGTRELAVGMTNGLGGGSVQVVEQVGAAFRGGTPISDDTAGIPHGKYGFCAFGAVLASGDVQGDGRDDLAVADPSTGCHDEESELWAGAVVLLSGSKAGLTVDGSQLWTQDSAGVEGSTRLGNVFGESLAMGPLDQGATADLAIGAPGDGSDGSVTVLLGGSKGLTTAGAGGTRYTQATAGIAGTAESDDEFGQTVTTAYLQSRSQASLVIGTPGEDVGRVEDAGAVTQLSIAATGPRPVGSRTFTADTAGVQGKIGRFEQYGGGTERWA